MLFHKIDRTGEADVAPAPRTHTHTLPPHQEKKGLFQVEKINIGISSKAYAFSHMMHEKLGSKSTHSLYTFMENDKVKVEKVTKTNLKIISKPRALLQTRKKTCAKFQKVFFKIV